MTTDSCFVLVRLRMKLKQSFYIVDLVKWMLKQVYQVVIHHEQHQHYHHHHHPYYHGEKRKKEKWRSEDIFGKLVMAVLPKPRWNLNWSYYHSAKRKKLLSFNFIYIFSFSFNPPQILLLLTHNTLGFLTKLWG